MKLPRFRCRWPWERVRPTLPAEYSRVWVSGTPFVLLSTEDRITAERHSITLLYVDEASLRVDRASLTG